jgi:hypothetical protein
VDIADRKGCAHAVGGIRAGRTTLGAIASEVTRQCLGAC